MTIGETSLESFEVKLHRVRVDIRNERLIPTITLRAGENHLVRPNLLNVDGDVDIIATGWVTDPYRPGPISMIEHEELD
jgi:hypothetical protein